MKTSILLAASMLALAAPASATTMIVYNGSTSGMVNALPGFNGTSSNTINGVTLSTTGTLKSNGNGMSDLTIGLDDATQGFGQVVIGLNATKGSPVVITGSVTLLDGSSKALDPFSYDYGAVGGGSSNLFIIQDDDNLFTSMTLTFSSDNSQIKSLYVGGIDALPTSAVPEPATWGLMILGFGLIGAAFRYRNVRTSVRFA